MWSRYLFLVLLSVSLFCFCSDKKEQNNEEEEVVFMIHNLGVSFGPYNQDTGMAGDFMFCDHLDYVFLIFGNDITANDDEIQDNPGFEYYVSRHAVIRSLTNSRVLNIHEQLATKDFKIRTIAAEGFGIVYNHITNHCLSEGDTLFPGDFIGNPGPWAHYCCRTSIQINLPDNTEQLSACPFLYLDPELKPAYENKILRLMSDWELFKSDSSLYSEDAYLYPGCNANFVSP